MFYSFNRNGIVYKLFQPLCINIMAVFGTQLLISMIVSSFLYKLSPYFSLGNWIVTSGLKTYFAPSDAALRQHVTVAGKSKKKGDRDHGEDTRLDPNLTLPKSASIELSSIAVRKVDVCGLHYYPELVWMVDFAVATLAVHVATFVYYRVQPAAASEYNLSAVWTLVLLTSVLGSLHSMAMIYFGEEVVGEKSAFLVFTAVFGVSAMGILLIGEDVLEFGLDESYLNLTDKAAAMFANGDSAFVGSYFPRWLFRACLALPATLLSTVLLFPGFRFAETHFDAIKATKNPLAKLALQLNYISPAVCLGLWIRPLGSAMIAAKGTVHLYLADVPYETFQVGVVAWTAVLRLLLYRFYLQAYLDVPRKRMEQLKKEEGRITVSELRKRVGSFFSFLPSAAVQYVGPPLLLLSVCALWAWSSRSPDSSNRKQEETAEAAVATGGYKLKGLDILGLAVYRGCFSFACWWLCFANFVASGFGSAMRRYL